VLHNWRQKTGNPAALGFDPVLPVVYPATFGNYTYQFWGVGGRTFFVMTLNIFRQIHPQLFIYPTYRWTRPGTRSLGNIWFYPHNLCFLDGSGASLMSKILGILYWNMEFLTVQELLDLTLKMIFHL